MTVELRESRPVPYESSFYILPLELRRKTHGFLPSFLPSLLGFLPSFPALLAFVDNREMDDYGGEDGGGMIPSFRFKWDVFLSFRGEDTRHTFTDRLYKELVKNGVRTFRDDEELQRGEEIDQSLLDAIQDSAAAVAIISRNYANSRWRLEELARILECRRLLLPVFYQVNPSDVRRQKGPFEEDFKKLEDRFGVEQVVRWRQAMEKAGGISGWDSSLWQERELIQSLVQRILTKLSNTPMGVAKYPVGLDSRLEELMRLLDVKGNGVKILGICGMGGSGKTTIAKALYNKLVVHFKRRSFISYVKEKLKQTDGLGALQSKLISDLSPGRTSEVNKGIMSIRETLLEEPVLMVLDDVDDAGQFETIAGKKNWFLPGSRIIITTRDKETIPEHIVDAFYEMKELIFPDALKLFSYHAFGSERPTAEFADVSQQVVSLTGGLPLALEVFGSFFIGKRRKMDWEDAIGKLKTDRPRQLQDVLEISFNGLDEQEKCTFLDIACFYAKMNLKREAMVYILKGYELSGETLIMSLTAKSLIKIVEDDVIWVHDQLRDMGRQIVLRESHDPGMRSRLWDSDDIMAVLENDKGTRSIQGIALDFGINKNELSTRDKNWLNFRLRPRIKTAFIYLKEVLRSHFLPGSENGKDVRLQTKSFRPMVNLRLLQINGAKLEGRFNFMPAELKCLQWRGCPLKTFPSQFRTKHLSFLDLSGSKELRKLQQYKWWNFHTRKGKAGKLLSLNLQDCWNLTDLAYLSAHSALEKLNLKHCVALVKIPESVGDMDKLLYLNLEGCSNLVKFPSDVSGLKRLEILILSNCNKLKELPEDMGSLKSLRELLVDWTAIVKLPDTVVHLKELEKLSLKDCFSLKNLPAGIGELTSLKELSLAGSAVEELPDSIGSLAGLETLNLVGCGSLSAIPDAIGNLKSLTELYLSSTPIKELPTSIASLSHLKFLTVGRCRYLTALPDSIGGLASLVGLWCDKTPVTEIPDQIGDLRMLEDLKMGFCKSLKSLPASIGKMLSITTLVLNDAMITELPESIGMLERLRRLKLDKCKHLQRLPASIGNLRNLFWLLMAETSVTTLPDEFGNLTSLMTLKMGKREQANQPQIRGLEATSSNIQEDLRLIAFPKCLSSLSSLEDLDACGWKFSGEVPNAINELSSLDSLNLSHNNFYSLPSSLTGLSILKTLALSHCKELKFLPPLPSSLTKLNVANCTALESIADLGNLESLEDLNLSNCIKIVDVPGLQSLRSLRRLYMGGCTTACLPAVRERLAKVALRHLRNLSLPGSRLPHWFVQDIRRFAAPKHRDIKGILIGVVVSLDQQTTDNFRDHLPGIVDIKAEIYRQDRQIFSTALNLLGVPRTDEDQLYLCRFPESHQLVMLLKEGDRIQIALRERPCFSGLTLKKYGIHLIFENDDDIEDDDEEELLEDDKRPVSWKLAKFIGTL